jgi:hypothetical protein
MDEPAELINVSAEPGGAPDRRQLTVRQGVVGSTLIAGDGNVVTQTVTIIHQYSRAEPEPEQPAQLPIAFPPSPSEGATTGAVKARLLDRAGRYDELAAKADRAGEEAERP